MNDLNEDQIKILDTFAKLYDEENEKSPHCFIGDLDEVSYRIKCFVEKTGFSKTKITKLRKGLAQLGYFDFISGLLSEDSGGYFGSGYFLTKKSINYVRDKVNFFKNERLEKKENGK